LGLVFSDNMASQFKHIVVPNNPQKVIKKRGIFQYEVNVDVTPWHVSSPLYMPPTTTPLSKFMDRLPNLLENGVTIANDHLVSF
jgi:hypothetical protein